MKRNTRKILLLALLIVAGTTSALFAQKSGKEITECVNRYWQFSLRGGYDFSPTEDMARYLNTKGGFNIGFGLDHYWKWFGLGADLDYINNNTNVTLTDSERQSGRYAGWDWIESTSPLNRLFIGIGPSFRLPTSCCPKFTAELNTRAGITRIAGSNAELSAIQRGIATPVGMYTFQEYDVPSSFALKGQLRLTYFFNKVFGLSAGAYYLHNFNINHSDNVTPQLAAHLTTNAGTLTRKNDLASFGVFGGFTFRICAERKVLLPPVPAPKATVSEYTVKGRITDIETNAPVRAAVVTLKNNTDNTESSYNVNNNGEYTVKMHKDKAYTLSANAKEYLPSEAKIFGRNQYDPAKTPTVSNNITLKKEPKKPAPTEYTVMGKVLSDDTDEPVSGAIISVENNTNGTQHNVVANRNGEYTVALKAYEKYTLNASHKGYLPSESKVFEKNQYDPEKNPTVEHDMYLTKVKVNEAIRLNNVHYDLNKATIRPDARPELDRLVKYLKDNPTIRVEMSSHTDSRGSAAYNQRLSKQRADAVKAYLVQNGIEASRIISVGYGETKLLNKCKDGVQCSDEEHQVNRRTEMKVISAN